MIVLDPVVAVAGLLLTRVAKCWYIDRMVLVFDEMKLRNPESAGWDC